MRASAFGVSWGTGVNGHPGQSARLSLKKHARTLIGAAKEVVAGRADLSFFVTENEAALFRQLAPECASMVTSLRNGVDGDYFSGVYVYGATRATALAQAERLGAISARHLAEAVSGKPGTGGGQFQSLASLPAGGGIQV